jgi:hypothetical protein
MLDSPPPSGGCEVRVLVPTSSSSYVDIPAQLTVEITDSLLLAEVVRDCGHRRACRP